MGILSNREIAAILWVLVAFAFVYFSPKMGDVRKAPKEIISAFFVWKLQAVNCLMLMYISLSVYFLYEMGVWEVSQLKNTIIWTCSVALYVIVQNQGCKERQTVFQTRSFGQFKTYSHPRVYYRSIFVFTAYRIYSISNTSLHRFNVSNSKH